MVKVGQRILTASLSEALVLQIEDEGYLISEGTQPRVISDEQIFAVICGPDEPETENVPHVEFKIETKKTRPTFTKKSGSGFFRFGSRASWVVDLEGAELEVRGFVLKENGYCAILSELGVSVAGRTWVVPLSELKPCLNIE